MSTKTKEFVTTYKSLVGWKAVLVMIDTKYGIYEPVQTGMGAYATEDEAVDEGRYWAELTDLPFIKRGDPIP